MDGLSNSVYWYFIAHFVMVYLYLTWLRIKLKRKNEAILKREQDCDTMTIGGFKWKIKK